MLIPNKYNGYSRDGRRLYHISMGDDNAAPEKTTQVADLPDWAKPYAKDVLEKGRALSSTPYQAYTGDRIAGFSPMQLQAQKSAAGLDAGPEGFAKGVSSYMSPYMQNVVDIQKQEAGRQSAIMGTQQQAQATQAGAFGGARDAIQRAERERNLGQQMNQIQAQGSQAAYDQAANQFRQGIGQQQNVIGMQAQLGGQEQALRQQGLTQAYQDFMAEKQAPYTQLGFMSDMIRGLPLGQQSTRSVYDSGGSSIGQTAGTALGLWNAYNQFSSPSGTKSAADGGLMESYADGGSVTSQQNIAEIVGSLSDQQLATAYQNAEARQDVNAIQVIQSELAMRASERRGMASVFNQLPDEQQEGVVQAAGGGIIAFDEGGRTKAIPERATSPLGDAWRYIGGEDAVNALREAYYKSRENENRMDAAESMYPGVSEALLPAEKKRRTSAADTLFKGPKPSKPMSKQELESLSKTQAKTEADTKVTGSPPITASADDTVAAPDKKTAKMVADLSKAPKPSKAEVVSEVEKLARNNDLPSNVSDAVVSDALRISAEFGKQNQPLIDEMRKFVDQQKPDIEAMRERGKRQAIGDFAANLASQAAIKGRAGHGRGLRGLLGSASAAMPSLSAAAAKMQELETAAQKNYAQLKMDQTKYEVALQKGDMQTATTLAGQIRQGQQAEKLLAFNIAHAKDQMALEREKIGVMRDQAARQRDPEALRIAQYLKQNPQDEALVSRVLGQVHTGGYAADRRLDAASANALQKEIADIKKKHPMANLYKPGSPERAAEESAIQREIDAATRRYVRNSSISDSMPGYDMPQPSLKAQGFKSLGQE